MAQITGTNPPADNAASPPCSPTDPCEPTGALAPIQHTAFAEPMVSITVPSMSVEQMTPAQAAILAWPALHAMLKPSMSPEPQAKTAPLELAALTPESKAPPSEFASIEPEPLLEPEPAPTVAAEPQPWVGRWRPATIGFAYANNHPVAPLAASVIEVAAPAEPWTDARDSLAMPLDAQAGTRAISRLALCSAIVSAARGNDLPIPFFANLIWQESNFHLSEISSAGALGVAQFIPETAHEHGLINPFEPIHAIYTSAKFLRRLHEQYGNLGYAAAAYNAGPGRVNEWLIKRRALPAETRAYVVRITGNRADRWASAEFRHSAERVLMPAKAPCEEVAQEVAVQKRFVRIGRLMSELAAATKAPPQVSPAVVSAAGTVPKPSLPRAVADAATPRPNPLVTRLAARAAAAGPSAEPAKINERAPTAQPAKLQAKLAPQPSALELLLGRSKQAAPARRHAAASGDRSQPVHGQEVHKDSHSDKKRAAPSAQSVAAR
jgi:hypothetical protein